MTEPAAWAILLLPIGSFLLISLIIRPFLNRYAQLSAYVTILAIGAALALSLWALESTLGHQGPIGWPSHSWMTIGVLDIRVGIIMDPLTAIMLVVATGVSLLVQIYSQGYMRHGPDYSPRSYSRYFAFMSLFTASMIGILLARSILQLYVFWELVGLCSYLLIGFWYWKPAAAAAAKKAFIITRIGDVGFLIAILYLFARRDLFHAQGLNPFEIPDIQAIAAAGAFGSAAVTWLALGIFAGAAGKSAQFPLHTWLPDAMEGPTPVSALIHAATMVAAGVFLVARFFPVFQASEDAMNVVALVGGFTALFAASMALVMFDIKRVLAYSTVSQLGYMMLALGLGSPAIAIFHLFTHAFFKALLFMGAGSVNHATDTFDMRYMGGLRRAMPWTYGTFLIASLSLAGIFPLAGFWSKDEILLKAWRGGGLVDQAVFWMALVGVFMTAFYIIRVVHLTFHGSFRGGGQAQRADTEMAGGVQPGAAAIGSHLAESPLVMVVPLVVLAVAAVLSGYLANPLSDLAGIPEHWIVEYLGGHVPEASTFVVLASSIVALSGIGLAMLMYQTGHISPEAVGRRFRPIRQVLFRKYYMDELYESVVVTRGFYDKVVRFADWVDREIVDRTVDGIAWMSRNSGRSIARLQTGQVQGYGAVVSLGILLILGVYLIWG